MLFFNYLLGPIFASEHFVKPLIPLTVDSLSLSSWHVEFCFCQWEHVMSTRSENRSMWEFYGLEKQPFRKLRRLKMVAIYPIFICAALNYTSAKHVSLFPSWKGWLGRLAALLCFSVAAPDLISQEKANGLDSRAQMTRQRSCPSTAGTDRPENGSCYEW